MKQVDKTALELMLTKIRKYVPNYDNYLANDASSSFNSYYPFVNCLYNVVSDSDDIDFINNISNIFNNYRVSLPLLLYIYDNVYTSDYTLSNLKYILKTIIYNDASTNISKEILTLSKFNYHYRLNIGDNLESLNEIVYNTINGIDEIINTSKALSNYVITPKIVYNYTDSELSFKNYYDAIKVYRKINVLNVNTDINTNNGKKLYNIINDLNNCFLMNGVNSNEFRIDNTDIFDINITGYSTNNVDDLVSFVTTENIDIKNCLLKSININNWMLCLSKIIDILTMACNYQIYKSNNFNNGYNSNSNETQFMNFEILKTLPTEFIEFYNTNIRNIDLLPCSINENISDCFAIVIVNEILRILNNENRFDKEIESGTELKLCKDIFADIINLQIIVIKYYSKIKTDIRFN